MKEVKSLAQLHQEVGNTSKAHLLLYKGGAEKSECALKHVSEAISTIKGLKVFVANVAQTTDIHPAYEITTAPVLLELEGNRAVNVIKGCHSASYYKALFENSLYILETKDDTTPQKSVTVYSTPTCSWCNTLKSHLRKHRIRFSEIDVSKDEQAAQEMYSRSGERGVPQTAIDGEMIVGFNQTRINELLGIRG